MNEDVLESSDQVHILGVEFDYHVSEDSCAKLRNSRGKETSSLRILNILYSKTQQNVQFCSHVEYAPLSETAQPPLGCQSSRQSKDQVM